MISPKLDPILSKAFLVHFESKQQMKDWIYNFLGLDFPDTHVDPESNSSPIDWMFEVYRMYKENRGNESPNVIVISSRESYKTLSEAVFAVITMCHFGAMIAHMAAIVPQATAAQKYIENFLQKILPYMDYHGLSIVSKNSKEVEVKMPTGQLALMKIIVCTITGANSAHTNLFTVDEIDTIRSQEGIRAYKEAQMIPGVFNGQHPISIKTSTLKFPGGLFMKEWDKAKKEGYKIFKWNLIDITEYCPPERSRPDLDKEIVYVGKGLPLKTIKENQFQDLSFKEQEKFDKILAKGGCAKCPLLPVCRGRLSERNPENVGGLWKPIDFTISQFKKTDPDLAESQLMCWKPSSQGMVYPRFIDSDDGQGNTYTLAQAWERFTATPADKNLSLKELAEKMLSKGIKFYCGVDWGHVHAFAIVVSAILPSGEWWIVDTHSVSGLEFDQMVDLAKQVRDTYFPVKWFCDTAEPMFIKTFRKNRMPAPDFKKDVRGGIEAVRGQILNASDQRKLKVIKHDRNDMALRVFSEHTFKLDTNGNLTDEPDDSEVADVADALRYLGQNLFAPKGKIHSPSAPMTSQGIPLSNNYSQQKYDDWLSQKIRELSQSDPVNSSGKAESGNVYWDFGDKIGD
jgi:hypothetical protein